MNDTTRYAGALGVANDLRNALPDAEALSELRQTCEEAEHVLLNEEALSEDTRAVFEKLLGLSTRLANIDRESLDYRVNAAIMDFQRQHPGIVAMVRANNGIGLADPGQSAVDGPCPECQGQGTSPITGDTCRAREEGEHGYSAADVSQ